MAQFDKVMQSVAETLYSDERLRSNLVDSEAKIVLEWAQQWISAQVNAARDEASAKQIAANELARVRQTLGAINTWAKSSGTRRLTDGVAAIQPFVTGANALPRDQILALLSALAGAKLPMRTAKKGKGQ